VQRKSYYFRIDEARAARAARFAAQLAETLHELGITHKELAQQLGVTHHTVDSWTRGTDPTIPGTDNLNRLCAVLESHGPGLGTQVAIAAGHKWEPSITPTDIRRHGAVSPVDEPPPNNLPLSLSSFVGRDREIEQVGALLSDTRLLTLTGPGGVGKTRLALKVASGALNDFADGVWLVELAALTDPSLVTQAVGTVFDLHDQPGRTMAQTLVEHLRPKRALLLLDNCEHVVAVCAALAATLLQSCPELTVLATSREALRVPGETVYQVPSMLLPDASHFPPPEQLVEYEAVRLFVERARAGLQSFEPTGQNAHTLAQICSRLDGVPLAIELAAACARVLSLEQIAARLDDRFRLLTEGSRVALPRHQTLRATLDWSYDLLPADEQALLNRLSVFAGGWTLEAAESVCSGQGVAGEQQGPATLDTLARLANKSLVVADTAGASARYRMLETVREYAAERLAEAGETETQREAHARYFLSLAERTEPELLGPQQAAWLDRLETEHDNFRSALDWYVGRREADPGLRLSGALARFWWARGHVTEGRRWLDAALELPGAELPQESQQPAARNPQLKALNWAGTLVRAQGDYEQAAALLEQSLSIARRLDDKGSLTGALNRLGLVKAQQGNYSEAIPLHEESLSLRRELQEPRNIAVTLINLARAVIQEEDYQRATLLLDECLGLFQELGDKNGIAQAYEGLGDIAAQKGDYASTTRFYGTSLDLFSDLGGKLGIAECLERVAGLAREASRIEEAARILGAAEALRDAIGAPLPLSARAQIERMVADMRTQSTTEAVEAAWLEGRTLPLVEAIAQARALLEAGPWVTNHSQHEPASPGM
jgi:non-specific serine/threonine protein kinase